MGGKVILDLIRGATIIAPSDLDAYDPSKNNGTGTGHQSGEIVSYVNILSANSYFHTLRAYISTNIVPTGTSPEDSLFDAESKPSGLWKGIEEQIEIPTFPASQTLVSGHAQLKSITNPLQGNGVIDANNGYGYIYNSFSTTTENIPYVVRPNSVSTTEQGRWILTYKFDTDKPYRFIIPEIPQGGGLTNIEIQLTSAFPQDYWYSIEDPYEEITDITITVQPDYSIYDAPNKSFPNKSYFVVDATNAINDISITFTNTTQYQLNFIVTGKQIGRAHV